MKAILLLSESVIKNETGIPVQISLHYLERGQTLFEYQLRLLLECEMDEVVVVGAVGNEHRRLADASWLANMRVKFVPRPEGRTYSMWLEEFLSGWGEDNALLLGDDFFCNTAVLKQLRDYANPSVMVIDKLAPLCDGALCVRADMSRLTEISRKARGAGYFCLRGGMKLDALALHSWGRALHDFPDGDVFLALQAALEGQTVKYIVSIAMPKKGWLFQKITFIDQVLEAKSSLLGLSAADAGQMTQIQEYQRYFGKDQIVTSGRGSCLDLFKRMSEWKRKKPLVVCDETYDKLPVGDLLEYYGTEHVLYPTRGVWANQDAVDRGVVLYREAGCDCLVSVGGRSAVDTAKLIGLYLPAGNSIEADASYFFIPHFVLPSLAACECMSTAYAILDAGQNLQLIHHPRLLASHLLLDPNLSRPLGREEKLRAFCRAEWLVLREIEWSIHCRADADSPLVDIAQAVAYRLALATFRRMMYLFLSYWQGESGTEESALETFCSAGQAFELFATLQIPPKTAIVSDMEFLSDREVGRQLLERFSRLLESLGGTGKDSVDFCRLLKAESLSQALGKWTAMTVAFLQEEERVLGR